jgi:hypothetical protein
MSSDSVTMKGAVCENMKTHCSSGNANMKLWGACLFLVHGTLCPQQCGGPSLLMDKGWP